MAAIERPPLLSIQSCTHAPLMFRRLLPPSARARAMVCVVAAGLLASLVVPSAAATPAAPVAPVNPAAPLVALAAPSPDLPGLPSTALELAQVPVASAAFGRATDAYQSVDADHTAARDRRAGLDRTATQLRASLGQLEITKVAADARVRGLTARFASVEAAIQELAVRSFVAGGEDERLDVAVASENPATNEVERRDVLGGVAMEVLLSERAAYQARIDEATGRSAAASRDLEAARASLATVTTDRPTALDAEVASGREVAVARVDYEEARVLATVDGVEFPLVALDAYYRAATTIAAERPACNVRWWGLAGISQVEGHHGTYGGTTLEADGDTDRRIIGIPLDGTNETAVIGDSDGGAYDGDAVHDRAVGPMQFIPQTWARFKADGNGDGTSSPFNLYDATLAAATYLCTASSALDTDAGLRSAYFAYNHSEAYVDAVLGFARLYERTVEVPDPED